jgi:hypothetical protein
MNQSHFFKFFRFITTLFGLAKPTSPTARHDQHQLQFLVKKPAEIIRRRSISICYSRANSNEL